MFWGYTHPRDQLEVLLQHFSLFPRLAFRRTIQTQTGFTEQVKKQQRYVSYKDLVCTKTTVFHHIISHDLCMP